MEYRINVPITSETVKMLKAGDRVLLTGTLYTARDAAHARLQECLENNVPLPFELSGNVIYYLGPSPARPGQVIGSAGPTTSGRMDKYTPDLLRLGLSGMIGKGRRTKEVIDAIKQYGAVYFAAIGGAGALLSKCIKSSEVIAYEDLGTEAVRKLTVIDFPCIVAVDSEGQDLYSRTSPL